MNRKPKTLNDQFAKEARILMIVVSICAAVFCYTGYRRMSGAWNKTPEQILATVDQKRAEAAADQRKVGASDDVAITEDVGHKVANIDKTMPVASAKPLELPRIADKTSEKPVQSRSFMVDPGNSTRNVKTSFDSPVRKTGGGGGFQPTLPAPKSFSPSKSFGLPPKTKHLKNKTDRDKSVNLANPFRGDRADKAESGKSRSLPGAKNDRKKQREEVQEKESKNENAFLVYATRSGDTLFDIARWQLGQASRYREILKLNKSVLPPNVASDSILDAGLRLKIPK